MLIEVWSDFACPFCYIGKTRLENAVKKVGSQNIEIVYKAYQLDPSAPKRTEVSAIDYYHARKGWSREQTLKMFQQIEVMAKATGLEYHMEKTVHTNTLDAHRLAKWAATFKFESELTNALMVAYFRDGQDIANKQTLLKIVKELDLDVEEAKVVIEDPKRYLDQVQAQIEEARQVGVSGVPFFVLNAKYGISGAQEEALFIQALNQVLAEEKQELKTFDGVSGPSCDDESCEF